MGFGEGLGTVIGSGMAADTLREGQDTLNATAGGFKSEVQPYNQFGQAFLPQAQGAVTAAQNKAGETQGYQDFMKTYETSPAAQYALDQAKIAQENSAAAKGGLLSGANERALTGLSEDIASTYANKAYEEYLAGNQQQFGQLEGIVNNMFQGVGVGTTATGQEAGVTSSQMTNQAALTQAQAKNDQSKGSGIGSLFSGITSFIPGMGAKF